MELIKFEDLKYPQKLREIENSPKRLYVEGNIELLRSTAVAVVGSRECTKYGEKYCKEFVKDLVKNNVTIVSGLALGIDKIAHETTINEGGKTIAVLPCGLENIYPKENKYLYEEILKSGGTVVSEYMPNTIANSKRFLERNRIVSGLSMAVLVVEAAKRSGTSVTAKLAKKQNREVFCIPGSLDNCKSVGTNTLIKQGAKIALSAKDIIDNYSFLQNKKRVKKAKEVVVKDEYKEFYNVIENNPIEINEISKKTNTNINEVMQKLTMMEIEGLIKRISGNRYMKF